ncbi:MAG: hypothetical protein M1565_03820 [Actinobacteria bacterium]|nr:hypothetical protein [Actinomycetota bacterium]
MEEVRRNRFGRRSLIAAAATALFLFAGAASAVAAEAVVNAGMLSIRLTDRVSSESCDACHGNIADTGNYGGTIHFEHGYHLLIECASCHTVFPHRPEGTIKPDMRLCWDCHGLEHGPMGELASGECQVCHIAPVDQLRPDFHGADWAGEPHVQPAEERLQTQCMMCHDARDCTSCHDRLAIDWEPPAPQTFRYDSNNGCQTCHGDPFLTKVYDGRPKSYQVTGVEDSAHRDITCQQCHVDFRYEPGVNLSPLWRVNAGMACRDCHADPYMFEADRGLQMAAIVAEYDASIHGTALRDRVAGRIAPGVAAGEDIQPPTCADCHGSHRIRRLDNEQARRDLHLAGYNMCGRCHTAEWESYDDPYHGAVYKRGALDAPACWDCHGAHAVFPSSDPVSLMSDRNIVATCGTDGCHYGSGESFTTPGGDLIHGKAREREANPIGQAFQQVREWLQ